MESDRVSRLELVLHALHDIEHIVAKLLGLSDKVHEEDSLLIVIFLAVDVEYVVIAQTVAQIVDFTLLVVGRYDFRAFGRLHLAQYAEHILHCAVHHLIHRVDFLQHGSL